MAVPRLVIAVPPPRRLGGPWACSATSRCSAWDMPLSLASVGLARLQSDTEAVCTPMTRSQFSQGSPSRAGWRRCASTSACGLPSTWIERFVHRVPTAGRSCGLPGRRGSRILSSSSFPVTGSWARDGEGRLHRVRLRGRFWSNDLASDAARQPAWPPQVRPRWT